MRKTTLLLFCTAILGAQTIDLNNIISYVRVHHPKYKAMEEESLALNAKILAENARTPISLSGSIANAKPDNGSSATEYSAGISALIDLTNTRGLALESADLQNEATLLYKQKSLFAFGNRLRDLYHQSCMDKEKLSIHLNTLNAFNRLYAKKEKAYRYQEISKKELLQLKLEKKLLEQKVSAQRHAYIISKEALLNLTAVAHTPESALECSDLYPVTDHISIENAPFILTNLAYEKEIESLDAKYRRYKKTLEPVALSLGYDDELDTKRTSVGFSVPLSFTSAKNEQFRIYTLHQKQTLRYRHHSWLLEQNAQKKELEAKLQNNFHQITALSQNIATYQTELMPLIEKSFQMGESSAIEYIMGRQRLLEIQAELINRKKDYYHKLFNLYTLIETEK
jgi:hypothetical protein